MLKYCHLYIAPGDVRYNSAALQLLERRGLLAARTFGARLLAELKIRLNN